VPVQEVIKGLEIGDVADQAYGSKLDRGERGCYLPDVGACLNVVHKN